MSRIQEFEVVIIPNEDEFFLPMAKAKIPAQSEFNKDKQGLAYTVEFFKNLGFEKVGGDYCIRHEKVYIICRDDAEKEQVSLCIEGNDTIAELKCLESCRGTADAVRLLSSYINRDCIIVTETPDFSLNFYDIVDVYRRKDCVCLVVLQQVLEHKADQNKANPIYGLSNDNRILSYADLLVRNKDFSLPKALLRENPSFKVHTNLIDCGIYIFSRTMLCLLKSLSTADDLKTDFLPTIIRRQHYYNDNEDYEIMKEIMNSSINDHIFRTTKELIIRAYLI